MMETAAAVVTENVKAVRDVSARRTATAVIMVVIDRRVSRLGRPEQRPDDARKISILEGADRCSEYLGVM